MASEGTRCGAGGSSAWLMWLLLAWVLGVMVAGGAITIWSLTGDRPERISASYLPVLLSQMSVVEGRARQVDADAPGLRLDGVGPEGRVLVLFRTSTKTETMSFERLRVEFDSSGARVHSRLVWQESGQRARVHPLTGSAPFVVDLERLPGWTGSAEVVGLAFSGDVAGAELRSVAFERQAPSSREVLGALIEGWSTNVPFSQSTINVLQVGAFSPLPFTVFILVGLGASFLILGLRCFRHLPVRLGPVFLALFLGWWFLFDLRWQWDLLVEHGQTLGHYAEGVGAESQPHEGLGGEALLQLARVARQGGDTSSRVFVVSPSEALGLYARYRVMPARGYAAESMSLSEFERIRSGDRLLLMGRSNVIPSGLPAVTGHSASGFPPIKWSSLSDGRVEEIPAVKLLAAERDDLEDGAHPSSWSTVQDVSEGPYRLALDISNGRAAEEIRVRAGLKADRAPSPAIVLDRVHTLRDNDSENGLEAMLFVEEPARIHIEVFASVEARVEAVSLEVVSPNPDWLRVALDGQDQYMLVRMLGRNALGMVLKVLP